MTRNSITNIRSRERRGRSSEESWPGAVFSVIISRTGITFDASTIMVRFTVSL